MGGQRMSEENREITLKIDAEHYSLIKEYSEYSNKSEQYILNRLLNHSLKKYAKLYVDLKKGYQKMADINLEISEDFNRMDD